MTLLSTIKGLVVTASGGGLDSSQVTTIASNAGLNVYTALDSLPTSSLSVGDQAYVSENQRMYISNGSGWYNVALINATPSLTLSASGTIALSPEGTPQVITITAVDSDNADASLILSVDSGGDFFKMATLSQDSSVFTITPRSQDSAVATGDDGVATLTFKASDGISFGTEQVSFTLGFSIENSNFTSLLMKADTAGTDNQVDASTNTHTITETGNVTSTAFTPYHPGGYSTYFDGTSSSNIQIKGESAVTVGTGDFSISLWYKGNLASNNVIASSVATNSTTQLYWNVSVRSDGAVWLQTRSTANSGLQKWGRSAAGRVTVNKWHHITVSRQSGWHYVAVDGVQDTSAYRDQASFNITSQELAIMLSNITGYASYGKGYIRDFNFCVGASEYDLSVGDGNVAYTVPTEPISPHANTKFLLSGLPYIVDKSASPLTIDVIGSAVKKLRYGPYDYLGYTKANHGGSVFFDGSGDYLTWGSSGYALTGAFEVEFWFYPTSLGGTYRTIFAINSASTGYAGVRIDSRNNDASGQFKVFLDRSVGGGWDIERNIAITVDQWYHVSVGRDASNVVRVFLNGILVGANATLAGTFSATSLNYIGCGQNGTNFYQGYVSDLRWLVGSTTRSADTSFIPPTTKLTAITNTDLLTCKNENDIWDAGQGTRLLKSGSVTASNTQRKFTTSSAMYFDGDDAVEITPGYDDVLYNFGTHDWTVEGWFYFNNLTGGRNLLTMLRAGANAAIPHFYTDGGTVKYYVSAQDKIVTSSVLTLNTWHHIAWVRNGNAHKIYVDGTASGTTWTAAQTYTQGRPTLGDYYASLNNLSGQSNLFVGYMQDIRFTKGLARYTSNFTPTATEHKG